MALNKMMDSTITERMKEQFRTTGGNTAGGEVNQNPSILAEGTNHQILTSSSITKRKAAPVFSSSRRKFGKDITNAQKPILQSIGNHNTSEQQPQRRGRANKSTMTRSGTAILWQERKDAALQVFRQRQTNIEDQIREGGKRVRGERFTTTSRNTQEQQRRKKRRNFASSPSLTAASAAVANKRPALSLSRGEHQHQHQEQEVQQKQPLKGYYYQQQLSKAQQHYRSYKDKYYSHNKNKGAPPTRNRNEEEEQQQVRDAKRQCIQVMEEHLMEFLQTSPNASYVEWLMDLHPDNTTTIETPTNTEEEEEESNLDEEEQDTSKPRIKVIDSRFFIEGNPWQEVYTQITSSPHFAMQSGLQKQQQQQQQQQQH